MDDVSTRTLPTSPVARLGAYGVILAAVLGGGAVVGAAIGPDPAPPPEHGEHTAPSAPQDVPSAEGLTATQDGYHLQLDTPTIEAGTPATLQFVIHAPDGQVLTDYDIAHEQELHLIVVGRDLRSYAHVHPTRDAAGTWTVATPALPAGPHRVYADFVPAGGTDLTLAADLGVAGDYEPRPVPAPGDVTSVDRFDVSFGGELVAGQESELTVTVTADGAPVTDLQPYLGALGHLVAIRDGDLAYLHVHPLDEVDGPGGPTVRFSVDVPTAGTYGLFFDFSHGGGVRTASVVTTAADATGTSSSNPHGAHDD